MGDGWQDGYQKPLSQQKILPIFQTWHDAIVLEQLPFYHKDPFDRMLISLAIVNDLIFISTDAHCHQYDLTVVY